MDYSEARDAFFSPRTGEVRALDWTTPARRLRDAIEPIATISFWGKPVYDAGAAYGLDFLQGYVLGRAHPLGDVTPTVAAATFGVFEPGLIAELFAAARQQCTIEQIRAAQQEGVAASLREVLGEPENAEGLTEAIAALRGAAEGAPLMGRALFAGLSGLPWPEDPWVQLWRVCSLLREHRGDSHLAAVVAAGLDGLQANVVTELWIGWEPLAYTGSRAWSPEAMAAGTAELVARGLLADDRLTEAGRSLRDGIEQSTDQAEAAVVDALGDGLEDLVARLDGWATRIVDQGMFPPDPYKRAAG